SSRRRHTRSKRDWSSDVCSSDLSSLTARQPFYEHLKVIVFSEELAREPGVFESLVDVFIRYHEMRRATRVFISRGNASDILDIRSEEHTSELQSRFDLVCRLLLE